MLLFGALDPIGSTSPFIHCGWDCEHYIGNALWLTGKASQPAYRGYFDIPLYQYALAIWPTASFGVLINTASTLTAAALLFVMCINQLGRGVVFASLSVFFLFASSVVYTYTFYVSPSPPAIAMSVVVYWSFLAARHTSLALWLAVGLVTRTLFFAPYAAAVMLSKRAPVAAAVIPWVIWEVVAGFPAITRVEWVEGNDVSPFRTLPALLGAMFDAAGYIPPAHITLGWTNSAVGSVLPHGLVLPVLPLTIIGALHFKERRVVGFAAATLLFTLPLQYVSGFNPGYFALLIPFIAIFNADATLWLLSGRPAFVRAVRERMQPPQQSLR